MKKLLIAASLAALLATGDIMAEAPKREFRSTWMAGMGIDWPYNAAGKKNKAHQHMIE